MPKDRSEANRAYYQANRERLIQKAKEYYQKNKKERMEYLKKKNRRITSGNYEEEWAKRHNEGTRKTPAVPCINCDRLTRGKHKCQYCGHEFMENERLERAEFQKLVYEEFRKNQA